MTKKKSLKVKRFLAFFLSLVAVTSAVICSFAVFSDRVDKQATIQAAVFNQDGYVLKTAHPTGPFVANENVIVNIYESNKRIKSIESVINMSVTWSSPDPNCHIFGHSNAADNATITVGGTVIPVSDITVSADKNTITFDLPKHVLSAGAKDVQRDLIFHIPDSLMGTGELSFTFNEVTLSRGGFTTKIDKATLATATPKHDFSVKVGWAASAESTNNGKNLMGYLKNTSTAGQYEIYFEFPSVFGDTSTAMKDHASKTGARWSHYKGSTTKLTFVEGMTTIGDYAFPDFEKITSLTLPQSTTAVGTWAFDNISIPTLTLPANTTTYEAMSFGHINELTQITFNTPAGVDMNFPVPGASTGAFYVDPYVHTIILGPNSEAQNYDWITDQRRVIPIIRAYDYVWTQDAVGEYVDGFVAEQADFHADAYRETVKTAVFADANTYYDASNYAAISAMKAAGADTYTSGNITYWNVTDPDHAAANPNAAYSVIAALDSTTGALTIMGDGGKVYANENSNFLFSLFTGLTSIDAEKYNTSLATSMYGWHFFNDPPRPEPGEPDGEQIEIAQTGATQIIGAETWDVSNVVDMGDMFHNAMNLVNLDVSTWNTESLVYANGTFKGMSKITSLDLSKWDMADVIVIESMFSRCESLTSLPIENWDVGKVQDMEMTFSSIGPCALDLSKWNTSSLVEMYQTFMNARMTSLNVTGWDVSHVYDMQGAFLRLDGPKTLDLSTWDVSSVGSEGPSGWTGSMYDMFGDSSLETINMTGWNFANCDDIHYMFHGCTKLKNIIGEETWTNTSTWSSLAHVFEDCESLESLDVGNWDLSGVSGSYYGLNYAFANCKSLKTLDVSNWNVSNCEGFDATFKNCSSLTSIDISKWDMANASPYYVNDLFYGCLNLTSLTFPEAVDFLETGLAANCPRLTTIEFLSTTSNMPSSFPSAGYLNEYNYGAFYIDPAIAAAEGISLPIQTNIVTHGAGMELLKYAYEFHLDNRSVDVPTGMISPGNSWYDGSVPTGSITSITFSTSTIPEGYTESWDASTKGDGSVMGYLVDTSVYIVGNNGSGKIYANPKSSYMFSPFTSVESINNLTLLDTSNAVTMSDMFRSLSKLTTLDVYGWDTSNVTSMYRMFYGLNYVTSLDLSSFDTSKVTSMGQMFNGMNRLSTITLGANFCFVSNGTSACSLPTPSATYITGADGSWHAVSDGAVYAPDNIPNNKADTYTAVDDRIFVNLNYMDGVTATQRYQYVDSLPTPTRDGYNFLGWYTVSPVTNDTVIDSFTSTTADYPWTQDADGVWSSGNAGTNSSSSIMVSEEFTVSENGGFVTFDWRSNGETGYDYLGFDIYDVTTGKYLSGKTNPSYSSCIANLKNAASTSFATYTYEGLNEGTYQLMFMFGKDGSVNQKEDMGFVKNVVCSEIISLGYGEALSGTPTREMTLMAKWESAS